MTSIRLDRLPIFISAGGESALADAVAPRVPFALLPGSFHPVHEGHWGLARAAEKLLGMPVAFELSIVNVDKPELTAAEVEQRVAQFARRANVWITRAPRFLDKAALFPGAVFVIGADTVIRLVDARYYKNNSAQVLLALDSLRRLGCQFLVAGRADAVGKFVTLDEVPIPSGFDDLFTALGSDDFRNDSSSTAIRVGTLPKV